MDNKNELYDESRILTLTINSWIYHRDHPSEHMNITTNPFPLSQKAPFIDTRIEWIIKASETIINKLTSTMIDEFERRGITKQSGKNAGSLDWAYEIINDVFKFIERKCPDFVKAEITRLEKRKLRVRPEVANMIDVEIKAIKETYNCK